MSYYAQFDAEGNQYQVASNKGWGQFGTWIEGLGSANYPLMNTLWETGCCEDLPGLTAEIEGGLENGTPDKDVEGVGNSLFSALLQSRSAELLLITNGVAADDTEDP